MLSQQVIHTFKKIVSIQNKERYIIGICNCVAGVSGVFNLQVIFVNFQCQKNTKALY